MEQYDRLSREEYLYCAVMNVQMRNLCVGVTHPGFEGDQFENHLHSEDGSEDHIQDVHNIIEQLGLTVVLDRERCDRKL